MTRLRIATLQLNPLIGHIEENIQRANRILSTAFPSKTPDLLVLPELALTGYNFANKEAIHSSLELLDEPGRCITWAKDVSKKYKCFTVLGYPELYNSKIFNSAVVINAKGDIIHNYHKSFLYETDEKWGCNEGEGFSTFKINGIRSSIGICMDLNPYKFEAPFEKFEFSNYCLHNNVKLLICPMAWLSSKSPSILENQDPYEKSIRIKMWNKMFQKLTGPKINTGQDDTVIYDGGSDEVDEYFPDLRTPDFQNLDYWILRFFPFLNHNLKTTNFLDGATLVISNRCGIENDVLYAGTSSIIQFNGSTPGKSKQGYDVFTKENKSVDVLGSLSRGEEGLLLREVDI